MNRTVVSTLLGLIGAVLGGLLGFAAFIWIYGQGFYALMLPGALLGLGCGLLARHVSTVRGIVCGLAAVALGIYADWYESPFVADKRFKFYLAHIHHVKPISLIMIALGGLFAYWWGKDTILASGAGIGKSPRRGDPPA